MASWARHNLCPRCLVTALRRTSTRGLTRAASVAVVLVWSFTRQHHADVVDVLQGWLWRAQEIGASSQSDHGLNCRMPGLE
jgi:hypothetical protein